MDLNTEYEQEIRYLFLARLTEPDSLDGANELSALLVELNNNNIAFKSISLRSLSFTQSLYISSAYKVPYYTVQQLKRIYIKTCLTSFAPLTELDESLALLVELDNKMHQSPSLNASFWARKVRNSSAFN